MISPPFANSFWVPVGNALRPVRLNRGRLDESPNGNLNCEYLVGFDPRYTPDKASSVSIIPSHPGDAKHRQDRSSDLASLMRVFGGTPGSRSSTV